MPTPPGFANVSIQLTVQSMTRPSYITFGVDPTDTDPQLVGAAVSAASMGTGSLMSIMDTTVAMPEVRVSLGTDGGEDLIGVYTSIGAGTNTKNGLPPNCAMLVHKITQRGGRRGRGRVFLPFCLDEGTVDEGGLITTTALGVMQLAMNTWRTALSTNGVPMVLLHEPSTPETENKTTPGPPNLVTALQVDKLISTQRRRLGR
jgi:hypothetical protein